LHNMREWRSFVKELTFPYSIFWIYMLLVVLSESGNGYYENILISSL
jgi:hypothetical protein